MIDVKDTELELIVSIIKKNIPDREVWAIGSRIMGTARYYSDIDLVILGNSPLSLQESGNLRNDFQESDLPFRVDLIDWNNIDEDFKKIILQKYEKLIEP